MMRQHCYMLGLTMLIGLVACTERQESTDKEQAVQNAVASAKAWLHWVDTGKYDSSWIEAAPIFKAAVTQERWSEQMQGIRKPMGEVKSRIVKNTQYRSRLPGAPDGEYVIIQFKTEFAHKKSAVETVTPAKDQEGEWRVSGYYIK